MTMLYGGQVSQGLRAFFYLDNVLTDPDLVQYSIFDPNGLPVKGQVDHAAVRESLGDYRADWTPTEQQPCGQYTVVWDFRPTPSDPFRSSPDEFNIVRNLSESSKAMHIPSGNGMGTSPGGSGAGNVHGIAGYVIRDFWGRVRVFNI